MLSLDNWSVERKQLDFLLSDKEKLGCETITQNLGCKTIFQNELSLLTSKGEHVYCLLEI